jgi:protein TonB
MDYPTLGTKASTMKLEAIRFLPSAASSNSHERYCEQPTSWSTRVAGLSGTAMVAVLLLCAALFTWQTVDRAIVPYSPPLMVELHPLAAPPKPMRHLPPGPAQVESDEAKPHPERDTPPAIPLSAAPAAQSPTSQPVEIVDPGQPVPQTTAPKSIVAPVTDRLASDARPDWEASVLAHLERFRRYPPRARAARHQGVTHVRFTMNRSGMVLSCAIVGKSGSFTLDQAALDTLRRAQPLPAIPAARADTLELTVPIEFELSRS